ncbi:MAG: hypothetical protein RLY31_2971 [Bacteroidota bacterium]|jgi:hypothetical protein
MKKCFLSTIAFLLFALAMDAQPPGRERKAERQEKVESFRIAFYTEKLQLTTQEAQAFWPVYNEYESKREAIRKDLDETPHLELMSDEAVAEFLDDTEAAEEALFALRKEYHQAFRKVLPLRKVAMLNGIEREFKMALLQEIRNRRNAPPPQGGNPRRSGGR